MVVTVAALLILSVLSVLGVSVERHRRHRAEERLSATSREAMLIEQLKTSVLSALKSGVVVLDARGVIIEVNEAWKRFGEEGGVSDVSTILTGANYRELCEQARFAGLPQTAEILAGAEAVWAGSSRRFSEEYRADGPSGERWFGLRVAPLLGCEGGAVLSHLDITEQRRGERALHTLNARLIRAQEEERRRIARELHDDIGQRVALLGMEIEQSAMAADPAVRTQILALGERAAEVATEIHRLSHGLHSVKLDTLGLVPAVRGYCRELRAAGLEVTFRDQAVAPDIPRDTALCVFRVVQESLTNVLRHGGVDRAEVRLSQDDHRLTAQIIDEGSGFDIKMASARDGIGLAGMRERLAAAGGSLTVRSRPGAGTTVEAIVPLPAAPSES